MSPITGVEVGDKAREFLVEIREECQQIVADVSWV